MHRALEERVDDEVDLDYVIYNKLLFTKSSGCKSKHGSQGVDISPKNMYCSNNLVHIPMLKITSTYTNKNKSFMGAQDEPTKINTCQSNAYK